MDLDELDALLDEAIELEGLLGELADEARGRRRQRLEEARHRAATSVAGFRWLLACHDPDHPPCDPGKIRRVWDRTWRRFDRAERVAMRAVRRATS